MGVEISRVSSTSKFDPLSPQNHYSRLSTDSVDLLRSSPRSVRSADTSDAILRLHHDPHVSYSPSPPNTSSTSELAGVYLGILNLYTTLPQFVGTFISMIVFAIFEPGKSPELHNEDGKGGPGEGINAIAICLFIGALSSLGACYATHRLGFVR